MSNAVEKVEEGGEVQDYSGGVLAVIERAVRDPSVDIDKMERLLAMQERVMERQAKAEFTEAKIAMRPNLPIITQKGRIVIKDKNNGAVIQETPFAKFEDIHEAVMPILTDHGFDLSFRNGTTEDGRVKVTTILEHVGGHREETEFVLPFDTSGSKNNVQAIGSSTSYGKRYGTLSILNIRVHGEDDDGEEAGKPDTITDDQRDELITLARNVKADTKKFCEFLDVPSFKDIPAARFDEARAALIAKGERDAAKK